MHGSTCIFVSHNQKAFNYSFHIHVPHLHVSYAEFRPMYPSNLANAVGVVASIWYTYLVNADDAFIVVSLKVCWSSREEKTLLERLDAHMEQCLGLFPEAICTKTL